MSSPALQWFGGDGRRRYGSRGVAALLAIVLETVFLYLLAVAFRFVPAPESPAVESIFTRLIDRPRGQYSESALHAISVHLNKLALRVPDTPPKVRIDLPEIPKVQQHSDIQASAPPGAKDKPGAESSKGATVEPGEGNGAAVLHEVGPVYGAAAVRSHEQGVVALRVLVDDRGRPRQVRLAESSGFPRLDESAIRAVQRYRFTPQERASGAGQSWTTVKLEFDLIPLPVPTTVIGFDSVVAKQIASARRVDRGSLGAAMNLLQALADDLVDAHSRGQARAPHAHAAHTPPTPLQVLARQGRAQAVQFVGYASRGFDCGAAEPLGRTGYFRCGIFKVRQQRGTSYWLAAMSYDGSVKSVAVTVAPGLR